MATHRAKWLIDNKIDAAMYIPQNNQKVNKINTTRGVSQGSVLGPTLWDIIYDVLREEMPIGTIILGYTIDSPNCIQRR